MKSTKTVNTTYLVIHLDALSRRNDASNDASVNRAVAKAVAWARLVNVTAQRRRRPRVVLLVRARQTATIRLGGCRAVIVNYIIVIVIDLGLDGRLRAFGCVNVVLQSFMCDGIKFYDPGKKGGILVTARQHTQTSKWN